MRFPQSDFIFDANWIASITDEATPGWRDRDPVFINRGFDVEVWRLSADHIVRIPRRRDVFALVAKEISWLPRVPRNLPLELPYVVDASLSSPQFPGPLFISQFIDGSTAHELQPSEMAVDIEKLGQTLQQLHQINPNGLPVNPVRGGSLIALAPFFGRDLDAVPEQWRQSARELFDAGCSAARDSPGVFIHGDVHRGNLMQNSGRLTSLIDFGDLGLGDPACDLGGALFCVGLGNQDSLVGSYEPVSHATITRARGWAAYFAVRHHEIGGVYTRAAEDFFASLSL